MLDFQRRWTRRLWFFFSPLLTSRKWSLSVDPARSVNGCKWWHWCVPTSTTKLPAGWQRDSHRSMSTVYGIPRSMSTCIQYTEYVYMSIPGQWQSLRLCDRCGCRSQCIARFAAPTLANPPPRFSDWVVLVNSFTLYLKYQMNKQAKACKKYLLEIAKMEMILEWTCIRYSLYERNVHNQSFCHIQCVPCKNLIYFQWFKLALLSFSNFKRIKEGTDLSMRPPQGRKSLVSVLAAKF